MSTSWPLQKSLVRIDPYAERKQYLDGNVTIDLKVSRIRGLVWSRTVHLFCVVTARHNNYRKQNGKENDLFYHDTIGKKYSGIGTIFCRIDSKIYGYVIF